MKGIVQLSSVGLEVSDGFDSEEWRNEGPVGGSEKFRAGRETYHLRLHTATPAVSPSHYISGREYIEVHSSHSRYVRPYHCFAHQISTVL